MISKLIKPFSLITGILFFLIFNQSVAVCGNPSIGFYYGHSFTLTEKPYAEQKYGTGARYKSFYTMDAKNNLGFSLRFFPFDEKLAFSFEVLLQKYSESRHSTINDVESIGYPEFEGKKIFGAISLPFYIDYSFFSYKEAKLIPYVNVGLMFIVSSNTVFGRAVCPSAVDAKIGGGVRYKIIEKLLINSGLSYFPANSFISINIGLEFVR